MMVVQRKRTMPNMLHIGRSIPHGNCSFCHMSCKTMVMYPSELPVQVTEEPYDGITAVSQLCAAFSTGNCVWMRWQVVVLLAALPVFDDGATVEKKVASWLNHHKVVITAKATRVFTARRSKRITAKEAMINVSNPQKHNGWTLGPPRCSLKHAMGGFPQRTSEPFVYYDYINKLYYAYILHLYGSHNKYKRTQLFT